MERMIKFLESLKMTIVGGIALVISLILLLTHTEVKVDPAWITVVISGLPLVYLALTRLIFQRWISSALLISIAMGACIYIGQLFAAGEVAFIMAIGALLEDYTVDRAKRGISKLISLAPEQGRRITKKNGKEQEEIVPIEQIRANDILRVLPGEKITVDGNIIYGNTSVDQSIMTGESMPIDKTVGDKVFCGTLNCYGSVDIQATKVGKDSSLQKMIDLVKEAENKKAPMQRIVDKWAEWLVPIALLIAIIGYFITGDLVKSVTVLVVFCPCALALATPVSIVAGIGQATKFGVLVKSGEALERMGKVNCITFDKTGTLTEGVLTVCDVRSFDKLLSEDDILHLTASVETRSEHPLGKAIVKHLLSKEKSSTVGTLFTEAIAPQGQPLKQGAKQNRTLHSSFFTLHSPSPLSIDNFRSFPGKGITAEIDGKTILCGKSTFLTENGIYIDDNVRTTLDKLRNEGKASVLTAVDGKCVGLLALSDVIRPTAKDMVAELNGMGVETVMLTGDNIQAANYLASQIGIKNIRAELLPSEKVTSVTDIQKDGKMVCMIGDGVNDAPALKTADVGVAMGSMGSDIAIDSADIALMGDDISKIPYLKRLSNAVIHSIKLNITISMCINFVAITLSLLGLLNPVTGALVHNAGSVLVVLNAALLYDRKI
ncbi:MAG: cation-translocating P-type ATPase [Prevotella sp.]|nr:cation-translocating P-type ATPase [Prevotella sp.]